MSTDTDKCLLIDGGSTDNYTLDRTGEPDGTIDRTGMHCWVIEEQPTPEPFTPKPAELPATGSESALLVAAVAFVAAGGFLRRLAHR